MPEGKLTLEANDIQFLLKVVIESKNINGMDIERAVFTLNKLQKMLKELEHV